MKKFAKNLIKTCFYIFLVLMFLLLLLFCLFQFGLLDNFVAVRFDPDKLVFSTSQVCMTDYNNNEITQNNQLKKNLSFEEIPQSTIDAFVSIEDKDFYKHHGINYKRILKASLKNLSKLSFHEGASTITQQLIKNTHLTNEKKGNHHGTTHQGDPDIVRGRRAEVQATNATRPPLQQRRNRGNQTRLRVYQE